MLIFQRRRKAISFSKQQNSNSQTKLFTNFCGGRSDGEFSLQNALSGKILPDFHDQFYAKFVCFVEKKKIKMNSSPSSRQRWKTVWCFAKFEIWTEFSTFLRKFFSQPPNTRNNTAKWVRMKIFFTLSFLMFLK